MQVIFLRSISIGYGHAIEEFVTEFSYEAGYCYYLSSARVSNVFGNVCIAECYNDIGAICFLQRIPKGTKVKIEYDATRYANIKHYYICA
jgi:hypothetical protein